MSVNRCFISGNLGSDPELRRTAGGLPVLGFTVAVNDRRKDPQTGEWSDYPNWIGCTLFGTRAEHVAKYLAKGSKVSIEGKLRWSSWEKNGEKRSKIEVIVDEIEFMSRSNASNDATPNTYTPQGKSAGYGGSQAPQSAYSAPSQSVYDEELPF